MCGGSGAQQGLESAKRGERHGAREQDSPTDKCVLLRDSELVYMLLYGPQRSALPRCRSNKTAHASGQSHSTAGRGGGQGQQEDRANRTVLALGVGGEKRGKHARQGGGTPERQALVCVQAATEGRMRQTGLVCLVYGEGGKARNRGKREADAKVVSISMTHRARCNSVQEWLRRSQNGGLEGVRAFCSAHKCI